MKGIPNSKHICFDCVRRCKGGLASTFYARWDGVRATDWARTGNNNVQWKRNIYKRLIEKLEMIFLGTERWTR